MNAEIDDESYEFDEDPYVKGLEKGRGLGRRWAEQDATMEELTRLRYFMPELPDPYITHYVVTLDDRDDPEEYARAFDDWWNRVLGEGGACLIWEEGVEEGFIDEALKVFDERKAKLQS